MAFKLGRITLNEPNDWDQMGESVTVRGSYIATSLADGLQKREQILAYASNVDEPIIPCVIDGMPKDSGYFRAVGAHILTDEWVRSKGNLSYELQLERMRGFTAPLLESLLIGALIPNNFSVLLASVQPWHAIPAIVVDYICPSPNQFVTRAAEDGTINFQSYNTSTISHNLVRGSLPPASFYTSAAKIEGGLLTATPYPIVGQQLAPARGDWRLTNGLVRVQSAASFTNGLQMSWYTGSAWGALKPIGIGFVNAGSLTEDSAVRILRNSPEECVLRVSFHAGTNNFGPVYLDVALRRGARVVRCYLTSLSTDTWSAGLNTSPASTALTAGTMQTAADSDGNKIVVASSGLPNSGSFSAFTQTNSGSSSVVFDFGIGAQVGTTTGGNNGQDLVYQYLAGQSESQRVVVR